MQTDFPIIDSHVHLYPDALAKKVTAALGAKFGNAPAFEASVAGCRAFMKTSGIAASLNLPVATAEHQVAGVNAWAAPLAKGPDVFSLAAFHPAVADKPAALKAIADAGFAGIKFHPEYQKFRFNDKVMDDAWAAMGEFGLVAYLHAGGERVFQPPFHSSPREILQLHRRFPKLRIAAAHLGGFGMWDESEELLAGQDVYLDLSHTLGWMDDAQILRMIRKHGAHRILFATDAPWQDPGKVLAAFWKLPLAEDERRAICHDNACELFHLEV